jgi:hypothetical protein
MVTNSIIIAVYFHKQPVTDCFIEDLGGFRACAQAGAARSMIIAA